MGKGSLDCNNVTDVTNSIIHKWILLTR